jgi:Putative restriction endonuclease
MTRWRVPALRKLAYYEAAQEYLRNLPLEHFMESVEQATQRKISVVCLDLIAEKNPEMHVYSELLVQYPKGDDTIGQVVPDNMVVIHPGEIKASGSFDVPSQPAKPFWVLEYVSPNNKRKDYDANFLRYEQELKVPYYLIFHPAEQELSLFRLSQKKYVSVKPNKQARLAIKKLEIEVAILDGWVRFWFQGNLVPLPEDLQRQLEETQRERDEARRRANQAEEERDEARRRANQAEEERDEARRQSSEAASQLARLQAELERLRKSSDG